MEPYLHLLKQVYAMENGLATPPDPEEGKLQQQQMVIGLDCEFMKRGAGAGKSGTAAVAMVQLSTHTLALLLHVAQFSTTVNSGPSLPACLVQLLNDVDVIKVGVSVVTEDAYRLAKMSPQVAHMDYGNCIDLRFLCEHLFRFGEHLGLKKLGQTLLDLQQGEHFDRQAFDDRARVARGKNTGWGSRRITKQMIQYASHDAWLGSQLISICNGITNTRSRDEYSLYDWCRDMIVEMNSSDRICQMMAEAGEARKVPGGYDNAQMRRNKVNTYRFLGLKDSNMEARKARLQQQMELTTLTMSLRGESSERKRTDSKSSSAIGSKRKREIDDNSNDNDDHESTVPEQVDVHTLRSLRFGKKVRKKRNKKKEGDQMTDQAMESARSQEQDDASSAKSNTDTGDNREGPMEGEAVKPVFSGFRTRKPLRK